MTDGWILGVDCGTQSLRAALYQPDGTPAAQAGCAYPTCTPRMNWAEQQPGDWWTALCSATRICLERARIPKDAVAALACDGTSYTGVFCTEDGRPLRPAILWMDLRAADEARQVEAAGHPGLDSCGRRISAEWLLPKALWVARSEPEIYAASARVVEGVDWLIYRLTGRWVTSNSNAAGKRHWTPSTGWPVDLYEAVGLPRLAGQSPDAVLYLGEPAAPLTAEAADALGLTPKCLVSHSGMDGWTSPVGKNCFAEGAASLTLGTSTVIIMESTTPRIIDGVMGPFPDGIRRGFHTYEAGQTSGASIIGWFTGLLGAKDDAHAHETLERDAAAIPPGAAGLVVFDAWRGNRTPYFDPRARGNICGLTLDHGPAHLYRAILEGCAYGVRNVVETLDRGGVSVRELRACGSGSANQLWVRIIASATGKPVLVSEEKHATCLGSAVCASVACGMHRDLTAAAAAMAPRFQTVKPGPERPEYDAYFQMYLETYRAMKDTMWELARRS